MQGNWTGLSLAQLLARVQTLAADLPCRCEQGDAQIVVQFASLTDAVQHDIAFLAHDKYAKQLADTQASAIVLNEATYAAHQAHLAGKAIIVCANPYAFFAFASQALQTAKSEQTLNSHTTQVHSTAVVGAGVVLGKNVQIAAYAVIEDGATIGDDCVIGAQCSVGKGAMLGAGTHLYAQVTVYHGVHIGKRCIVHSGTVIGADGFGFALYQKRWIKIPQTGTVRIGDDVEIGSNCAVDRGALGDTVIGRGTKLDNLIQVAHNVHIGEDCAFAANIAIAGSAVIGNRVQMGGKAGVLGHLSICDDVVISSCTLVTKTIAKPGFYTGVYPLQDNADWEKNAVSLKRLNALREQVKDQSQRLAQLEKTLALKN